jgi:DNA uptake protein ComE-like DNA-binding protein
MKKAARSVVSFTRTERTGILVLSVLLIVLIGVRLTMHYCLQPPAENALEQKLRNEWAAIDKHPAPAKTKGNKNETSLPDSININAVDIETLKKFPGIADKTAQKIIDRRNQNGPFKTFEELRSAASITDKRFDELKKHIYFGPPEK